MRNYIFAALCELAIRNCGTFPLLNKLKRRSLTRIFQKNFQDTLFPTCSSKMKYFIKKETLTRDYGKQESEKRDKMTIYHISDVLSGQTELSGLYLNIRWSY